MKKVLVACEESQAVTKELRKLGIAAFSCDLQESSGGHPEWHIITDVAALLNGNCEIMTESGNTIFIDKWDGLIAHPPCTYLTVTGNRWFNVERYGDKAIERYIEREKAIDFFMLFANSAIPHIIENPIGIMSTVYRKPDYIIQPYFFGDPYEKKTCLWCKDVAKIEPTNIVKPEDRIYFSSGKSMPAWYCKCTNSAERAKLRSKTFPGIAQAIAESMAKSL